VRVEFFGIPRERTGVTELELNAETLGELLATLAIRFPSLGELVHSGRLASPVLANLNGKRFVTDPKTKLHDADYVLILSADAGG
jgi:molybdopterin converting factor small subunit